MPPKRKILQHFLQKYYSTYHGKSKMKLYQKALGEGFVFTKFYPLPTLSGMRVGNSFKKFIFLQKKYCNLTLLHV